MVLECCERLGKQRIWWTAKEVNWPWSSQQHKAALMVVVLLGAEMVRGFRPHVWSCSCLQGRRNSLALPDPRERRCVTVSEGRKPNDVWSRREYEALLPQLQMSWLSSSPSLPPPHHVKVSSPRCLPSTWLFSSRLWLKQSLQWPVLTLYNDQIPQRLSSIQRGLGTRASVTGWGGDWEWQDSTEVSQFIYEVIRI